MDALIRTVGFSNDLPDPFRTIRSAQLTWGLFYFSQHVVFDLDELEYS